MAIQTGRRRACRLPWEGRPRRDEGRGRRCDGYHAKRGGTARAVRGRPRGCFPMRRHAVFALFLLGSFGAQAEAGGEIRVALFDYCPYVCDPAAEGGKQGIAVEVLKAIYQPLGYKLSFRRSNFKRALLSVEEGSFDVIPMLNPNNSRSIALSGESWISLVQTFYVKRGKRWRYRGLDSLHGRVVGTIAGYNYGSVSPEYENYLVAGKQASDGSVVSIASGDSVLNMLKLIDAGRVDVFNEDAFTVDYMVGQRHLRGRFSAAGVLGRLPQYTGFSKKNPQTPKWIGIFDKGIQRLARSGEFDAILLGYGLRGAAQGEPAAAQATGKRSVGVP
ncbi:hypothetical protein DK842_20895 [Chromobacterium phragmitis]|nr:hypothetical protein DK842_20895 [Chromobacterium phragmitis]